MTNLDIAQSAKLRPIDEVAAGAGLSKEDFDPVGRYKAKLTLSAMRRLGERPTGKLILVTAVTPTPAGEGKTTMTIGLAQGLAKLGKNAIPATREPALGPVFGVKGGAAGGGYSQVLPMEEINLFFTGDFPAVTTAHNLLSAMVDAHVHNGNELNLDVRSIWWPRAVDMNDRALREIVVGLGGASNGYPREDRFVITPASEVMAILCLARSLEDLRTRLGRIVVGTNRAGEPVTAEELKAAGAMAVLLKDAIRPNLVQTLEGGPAFVHGGPFGNIAHGCSSLVATRSALGLADYVVTEAGFGSDLGAEKFFDIKCRALGRGPDAIVLVVTVRALQHHGGGSDLAACEHGLENLWAHHRHLSYYGPPVTIAINRREEDPVGAHELIVDACMGRGLRCVLADPWNGGGTGCCELAEAVIDSISVPSPSKPLYDLSEPFEAKLERIVEVAYGGLAVEYSSKAQHRLEWAVRHGFGELPVVVAKTQYSLSDDPHLLDAPDGFTVHVKDVSVSAGAGFLVAQAGEIMLMPGLGKHPSAVDMDVDAEGRVRGLF
ncbi:MAG TPA: formate--tetrahydrofolate ligase [Fimbriimonadaceae bacterium]|nr:formate--tetrahydrofolate ligase [Fimbriimonadaceae bacterium]